MEMIKHGEVIRDEYETVDNCVSRAGVITLIMRLNLKHLYSFPSGISKKAFKDLLNGVQALPSVVPTQRWIPVSERLPKDIRPVNVTWKNIDPKSYYQDIAGKHFTGTACYKNGKWYWYSSTTEDILAEYGRCDSEEFDEAIECIAWMPLPESYKESEE